MRSHLLLTLAMVFCLVIGDRGRSFVETAPLGNSEEISSNADTPQMIDEVKQLEELKHSFGKTFSVLKTHSSSYSDMNGQREGHSETQEEVKSDGKLLARVGQKVDKSMGAESNATPATRVQTELDIPARGIHKTMTNDQQTDNGNRRSIPQDPGNSIEKYIPYSGIQYSPLDMAEYVFWTGDEKGVTLAIEEFLQEGLMTREEAINFLQEIKFNLDYLQSHYSQQRLHKQEEQQAKERATLIQKALGLDKPRVSESKLPDLTSETLLDKKNTVDVPAASKEVAMLSSNRPQQQNLGLSDEDYEELLERLRVADFLYTEYSLEEVIYQLAKVMFSQSLTKGSAEAQEALQKFTNFLEAEAEQGHISRSLEKKVLDVLIAALTDTLSEQPHLMNAAREGLAGSSSNQLLHQLLLLNPGGAAGDSVSAGSVAEAATADSHQSTQAKGRERQAENIKTNKTT